jgi:hypothetical protein
MPALALSTTSRGAVPPAHHAHLRRSRVALRVATSASKDQRSGGIHDPSGPSGATGSGLPKSGKMHEAQEEGYRKRNGILEEKELRASQRQGHKGSGNTPRVNKERIDAEIREVEEEAKPGYTSDEEYKNMGRVQKWVMEAKAALYAWLKTGVEPL